MTGAEPGCVSEQDGVAGSGCGVRSALLSNAVTLKPALEHAAQEEAHGGGRGVSKRLRRARGSRLWLWLCGSGWQGPELGRMSDRGQVWLCGFFL